MSEAKSQVHLLLDIMPRLLRMWKPLLVLWVLATIAAGAVAWKLYVPTYTSECVILVRPLNVLENPIGKVNTDDEVIFASNPLAAIMPDALTVDLYEAMLKTDPILAEVQRLFLERHGADYPPEKHPRRYQMREWMKAEARVSLKSTMAVEYNPSVFLRVQAPDPGIAHRLMVIWVEVAEEKFRSLLFSSGMQRVYELADAEYQAQLAKLEQLDQEQVALQERQIAERLDIEEEWAVRMADAVAGLDPNTPPDLASRLGIESLQRRAAAALESIEARQRSEQTRFDRNIRNLERQVEDMAASRAQASLVVARQAEEFSVLSEPTVPEVLPPPPLRFFLLGAAIPIFATVLAAAALWLVLREINRRYAPAS
jgi:hypothetical protein